MANIKSSKKRAELGKQRNIVNSQLRSKMRNQIKKSYQAIEQKDENAQEVVQSTIKNIDKMAQKGLLHKNNAAKKVSSLQKSLNTIN